MLVVVVTVFYAMVSIKQNSYWLDAVAFYKKTLTYSTQLQAYPHLVGQRVF